MIRLLFNRIGLLVSILLLLNISSLEAQNINGEKIIVGKESITIINFADKVLNINFSDDEAYDFYIPKRREEKSISIQFNKEKQDAPNTEMLVNEGGRSHMFRIIFDSTYNINEDTRPPLWYDHSNLKELKVFVQKQKELEKLSANEKEIAIKQQEKEKADQRKKEALEAQEQAEEVAANKAKEMEKQRKEQEEKQKQSVAELAKAKKEAEEKEKQLQLAEAKEAEAKKIADQKTRQEADALAKQKAEEEKQLAALKEKALKDQKAAEALAKAQKAADERKRIQDEKLSKQKMLDEEKREKATADLAKKEEEKKIATEKLAKLEEERKEREKQKAYSEVGLWQRYGKKGIDVYNFPREQINTVVADFYIIKDTLRNYHISDSMLHTDMPHKVNIEGTQPTNKDIKFTIENIYFKEIFTYYKIKIENKSDEDFLVGPTYMYW
ncbi:MAG: hypothetical protein E6Q58_00980, partial [Niabella sp.]